MAGCGDVLSLEDLQTAKKHQIFEAEVITGKAGGVAGGATIGTATNPVTGQTQQTLPSLLADLGFDVQSWTSSTGGVLASANQVFLNDTSGSLGVGDYYAWGGTFPKTVPAGTDPALPTSGYIMRSSRFAGTQAREALRRSYAEAGYSLVDGSFEAGGTLMNTNDVLLYEAEGGAYSYLGVIPTGGHPVASGTNPVGNANWMPTTDNLLRQELASINGTNLIGVKRTEIANSVATTLQNWIRWTGVNVVSDFGADPTFTIDSTVAIKNAIATGRSVYIPAGHYQFNDLLFPAVDGQTIGGEGQENTILENNVNNEPLFCFGNPYVADGSKQWCTLRDLTLKGNNSGATLWGIFCPNAALVDGNPTQAGQYEGVSSSVNNLYYGRTSTTFADWTIAARGGRVMNVGVLSVKGGYAMHVSAWDFHGENVRLWSGKQGLRNCGAANSNTYEDFYISAMTNEGLFEPDTPSSITTGCIYNGLIIQQCGPSLQYGRAAIEILKGQGTSIQGLYLEKNNEKGTNTDIFIGVSAIGVHIDGVRQRVEGASTPSVVIETQGEGVIIDNLIYGPNVTNAVKISGSDARTKTVIGVVNNSSTAATLPINDVSTSNKTIVRDMYGYKVHLGHQTNYAESTANACKIRQGRSTGHTLDLVSSGSMKLIIDPSNLGTGRNFKFAHNGEDGTETTLMQLADSGNLTPGSDNLQNLGSASARMATLYAGTGTINTSDAREKTDPLSIDDAVLDAWGDVQLVTFQWLEAIRLKGDDARWHFGVIAQQVRDAFLARGLDGTRYGLLCYDEWDDQFEQVVGDDGEPTGEMELVVPAGNRWGIRPDQFLFLEAAYQRRNYERLLARVEALEAKA